jgi:gliding motility-associated-like protein
VAQQNLIYNGDFEIYDTCPSMTSSPGDDQIRYCLGWKTPTKATSDYYNSCATSVVSTPINNCGFQYPYSGQGYCGIFIEYVAPPFSNYGYWFEYVQGQIVVPLNAGNEYEFSCRVVMSELGWDYALWKFGAAFTSLPISKTDGKPFNDIIPQVLNSTNNFLTDTLNWIEIKGRFLAQGNEKYITLGFFSDTLNLDTLKLPAPFFDPNHFGTYYYIDYCSLIEIENENDRPNIFTPNGDGQNDVFLLQNLREGEEALVYNRWGIKVAEISNRNNSWDGRSAAGENCVNGVYYYIIHREEEKKSLKGFIQLVR